jgi:Ca2+-binding EF-hand superfamily protein
VFAQYDEHFVTSIFTFLNTDQSGRVHPAKLLCAINLFCRGSLDDKARVFFAAYDEDNSDTLSRDEFAAMLVAVLVDSSVLLTELVSMAAAEVAQGAPIDLFEISPDAAVAMAHATFDAADADRSGTIDFAEFAAWAKADVTFSGFMTTHEYVFGAAPPLGVPANALDAFQQTTQFRRLPIEELFDRYLTLDTDENDEIGADGVVALVTPMFSQYASRDCRAGARSFSTSSAPAASIRARSSARSTCSRRASRGTRRASSSRRLTRTTATRSPRPSSPK